jgi:predicted transcriptional regulator
MSRRAIAEALGVSHSAVKRWCNPEKNADYERRRRDRIRRAKQAEERRIAKARLAARNASKPLAQTNAMAEKMQDVLGQAHAEATDSEARRALAVAGEHYRKMRDEIVRALGVS